MPPSPTTRATAVASETACDCCCSVARPLERPNGDSKCRDSGGLPTVLLSLGVGSNDGTPSLDEASAASCAPSLRGEARVRGSARSLSPVKPRLERSSNHDAVALGPSAGCVASGREGAEVREAAGGALEAPEAAEEPLAPRAVLREPSVGALCRIKTASRKAPHLEGRRVAAASAAASTSAWWGKERKV